MAYADAVRLLNYGSVNDDPVQSRIKYAEQKVANRLRGIYPQSTRKLKPPQEYSLQDEDRRSLLKKIGDKTLGSLYKFANVLDLPVSSVRDTVNMAVTGKWTNPFDQWLSPTTDENRVQARDLLRNMGLARRKDTWGNLAGGIATDILLDPLTYMTFGAGGITNALSKHGKLVKEAGLLEHIPGLANKLTKDKILKSALASGDKVAEGLAGKPLTKELLDKYGTFVKPVGKREATQSVTDARQIIDAMSDPVLKSRATEKLNQAAERFGFKSYDEFLAANPEMGLQGLMRFGAPNFRMFGADPRNQLKQAPHVLLGKPGSEFMMRHAKRMDAIGNALESTPYIGPVVSATQALLNPSVMGMMDPANQRIARQHFSELKLGQELVGDNISSLITDYDKASGGAWSAMMKMDPKEVPAEHRKLREMFELYETAPQELKHVMDRAYGYNKRYYSALKTMGVNLSEHEDDFVHYFARKITDSLSAVKDADVDPIDLVREVANGSVTNVFNEHFIGRHGLFTDIQGGTKAIDTIVTDKDLWDVIGKEKSMRAKIDAATKYIKNKHRGLLPEKYRGEQLSRKDLSFKGDKEFENVQRILTQVRDQRTYEDILADTSLTEAQKIAEVRKKMSGMGVRLNPNAEKDIARRVGAGEDIVQTGDRVFQLKKDRHRAFAEYLVKNEGRSKTLKEFGLFGNHPFFDLEQSLAAHQDSLTRATMVMDMLSQPEAVIAAGTNLDQMKAVPLAQVFKQLGFAPDEASKFLAGRLSIDPAKMGSLVVDPQVAKDLSNIEKFFHGPDAVTFFGKMMDSWNNAFKANVTSPFPAFHVRNLWSGQLRNAVGNAWSPKAFLNSWKMLRGQDVEGLKDIPYLQQRWQQIIRESGDASLAGVPLDDVMANNILRRDLRPHKLVGAYGEAGVVGEMQQYAAPSGGAAKPTSLSSTARGMMAGEPGRFPMDFERAGRKYVGAKVKRLVRDENGNMVEVWEKTTKGPNPFTFANPLEEFNIGKRGLRKLGIGPKEWGDKDLNPMVRRPDVLRVPGTYEKMGMARNAQRVEDANPNMLMFGPVEAGYDFGHAVEFLNRLTPVLHKLEAGSDLSSAVKEAISMQIPYGARNYTPFENKILKRVFPFYSFTSRSLPWAMRKFIEQPGNLLRQVIRGATDTGEFIQEQHQTEGPVPPYLRDTLAIPMPYSGPAKGTKRFFTGVDVMSQDLWQMLMPLLSGEVGEFGYELAGRSNPLFMKAPLELMTGTSLFQRGVGSGRPLRTMDPAFGRFWSNVNQTWAKATGEELDPQVQKNLMRNTVMDTLISNSPLSRYLSTGSTLFDTRKGAGAKIGRLGFAAGIHDVSPTAQQAILREYLREMIRESGGKIFEKASFPKEYMDALKRIDPQQYEENMKLKLLNDELAKVAKQLKANSQVYN